MKIFKTILVLASLFVFCNINAATRQSTEIKQEKVSIEKLSASFTTAWNKRDSAAVVNLLADDAMLMTGKSLIKNRDSLIYILVSQQMHVTQQLNFQILQSGMSNDLGYESGNWSMQIAFPNQKPVDLTGNYTLIWKKQKDKSWKIGMMELENHPGGKK